MPELSVESTDVSAQFFFPLHSCGDALCPGEKPLSCKSGTLNQKIVLFLLNRVHLTSP